MDNAREFYRLDLFNLPIRIETQVDSYRGQIRDISKNGMAFYTEDVFNFKRCKGFFELEEEEFEIEMEFIRKGKGNVGRDLFACKFVDPESKAAAKLFSILLRIDAMRRNNLRDDR